MLCGEVLQSTTIKEPMKSKTAFRFATIIVAITTINAFAQERVLVSNQNTLVTEGPKGLTVITDGKVIMKEGQVVVQPATKNNNRATASVGGNFQTVNIIEMETPVLTPPQPVYRAAPRCAATPPCEYVPPFVYCPAWPPPMYLPPRHWSVRRDEYACAGPKRGPWTFDDYDYYHPDKHPYGYQGARSRN